jgi:hypothetical protein
VLFTKHLDACRAKEDLPKDIMVRVAELYGKRELDFGFESVVMGLEE